MFDSLIDGPLFGSATRAPDEGSVIVGGRDGERILVPLVDLSTPALTDQVGVATTIARTTGASLHLLAPVSLPAAPPTADGGAIDAGLARELREWAITELGGPTPAAPSGFLFTRGFVNGIHRTIDAHDVDVLVLPSAAESGLLSRNLTDSLVTNANCDVVVVNGRRGYGDISSVLLPIAGGPHSTLAVDTAARIAAASDAWVDILHVVEEDAAEQRRRLAERYVETAAERIDRPDTTSTWILEARDVVEAIIEQSRYYRLTIIGAPTVSRLHRFVYGSTNRSIRADAESVVLSTKRHGQTGTLLDG